MSKTLFAGIDAGTGGARCLVVDQRGARVAHGARAWTYRRETGPGLCDLDPAAALDAVIGAVQDALTHCDADAIAGVGVTSQRSGIVLLDEAGEALHIGPNADARAVAEGIALERAHGPAIYATAGRLPAMLYLPARLAWFRAHEPATFARARTALAFSDWIVFVLTGVVRTEPTQAAESLCYDVAARAYSEPLMRALGVDPSLLPPIDPRPAPVTNTRFGFRLGTLVAAAGADTQCAVLAMGAVDPGAAVVVTGTTMLCDQVVSSPVPDPHGRMWTSPDIIEGFVREAHCGEAGAPIDWLASIMGLDAAAFCALAEDGTPGAGGVSFVDSAASNMSNFTLVRSGALMFPVPLIALARPRADVARAALEGVAFGARSGLAMFEQAPNTLAVAGGLARARVFARALAGACERPVVVADEPSSSALGAAIVAAATHRAAATSAAAAHRAETTRAEALRAEALREVAEAMHDRGHEVAPRPEDGYPSHYATWSQRAAALEYSAMRIGDFLTMSDPE